MPRGDRTGPNGAGPRTGRGLGYCNGYQSAGFNHGFGAGYGNGPGRGLGYGRGAGYGRGFYREGLPSTPPVQDTGSLQQEARSLMDRLKGILEAFENTDKKEQG